MMFLEIKDSLQLIHLLYKIYMYLRFRDSFKQIQFLNLMYMYLRFRDLFHQIQFLNLMYMYLRFTDLFHQIQFLNLMYMYLRFTDLFHQIQFLNLMYMYLRFRDLFHQIQFLNLRLTKNPLSFNPVKTAENAAGHQSLQFSEATSSLNIDANNALKSFFQGSHIYCGTFNISVNFQLLPAAKRPGMENGS